MKKHRAPKFSQHLLMFGDTFEPNVVEWFGKSFVIEYEVNKLSHGSDLQKAYKAVNFSTGKRYSKITEVISGTKSGRTFASMSGSYPVIIDISTPHKKSLLTKISNVADALIGSLSYWDHYDDELLMVIHLANQLQKPSTITLSQCRDELISASAFFDKTCEKLCTHNLRKLWV